MKGNASVSGMMDISDSQIKLPDIDDFFLSERLKESRAVVREVAEKSVNPLIIQFSGGRDSMAMLGLVREVTSNFVCAFMATGMEFKGVIQFVKDICEKLGVKLLISNPGMYKGNIFKRIEQFRKFPGIWGWGKSAGGTNTLWCCRDLKLRPQKLLLRETFGKGVFYKLEGIRMSESTRRKYIYKEYSGYPVRPDGEHRGSFEVFPIINWTDDDVCNYLKQQRLPTLSHYDEFGVSGCSWCPFYGPEIYRRVLAKLPRHYDRFIHWEKELGKPSVTGNIYLGDIKREVLDGVPLPAPDNGKEAKSPCTMMFEGNLVKTCDVYGHFYMDGECFRCGEPQGYPG